MDTPIKIDALGVALFLETPIYQTGGMDDVCFSAFILNHILLTKFDVSKNMGVSPQIIHFNRVFHDFHHPFWGFYPYFWVDTQFPSKTLP